MKKITAIILLLLVISTFSFASDEMTYGEILLELGFISGNGFGADEWSYITREEMITILNRLYTAEDVKSIGSKNDSFGDAPQNHWAIPQVEYARENGLTSGKSESRFGYGEKLTYQEAITFIMNSLGEKTNWNTVIKDAKEKYNLESMDGSKSDYLIRENVFELITKALTKKDISGQVLINKTGKYNQTSIENFLSNYENKQKSTSRQVLKPIEIGALKKSVVYIEVVDLEGITSTGSGFFISSNEIVTNYHVIENASVINIYDDGGNLITGDIKITGYDLDIDIAILKISSVFSSSLKIGKSDTLMVGETIYTIGSPYGLQNTLSEGIVSGLRTNEIQISAPISPGSSGGALINEYGEVVGITTSGISEGENLGFCIPIESINNLKPVNLEIGDLFQVVEDYKKSISYENGDEYYGEVSDGLPNGLGTYIFYDGDSYTGYLVDGIFNGVGLYQWVDGETYYGDWLDGYQHGFGEYVMSNGDVYTGDFEYGNITGVGKLEIFNGAYYFGEFKDFLFHGAGEFYYSDGQFYSGNFKNDYFDGYGKMSYINGDVLMGYWSEGLAHGYGIYTFADGSLVKGIWSKGDFVSYAEESSSQKYESILGDYYIMSDFSGFNYGNIYELSDARLWKQASYEVAYKYTVMPTCTIYADGAYYFMEVESMDKVIRVEPLEVISNAIIWSDFSGIQYGNTYELSNGQVWKQTSFDIKYSYKYYPSCKIYKDGYNYMMKIEGVDKSIKVELMN